ncbi:MAG: M81 family metallopeptidase [Cohaesibacteraceae bacterium]|nr:M81 family metallopeptidase [Cohaesibacteraceae bacterium]MBL4875276.1 M81 family metallopeptidase [Cohaesibacteraceae bacterium]
MRLFTAALATETNTFSPIAINLSAFEDSLYAKPGEHPDTPTLCSAPVVVSRRVAKEEGWDLIEGTSAWADPAGLINRETYEGLRDEILDQLKEAMPVDAVVLGLHGAMVANGYDDPEGDFLSRIRRLVGPDILVCATLDPHSHLTQKRFDAVNFFVAFKEFPHTDFVDRAEDLLSLVKRTLKREINPVMAMFDCKMIDIFPTSRQPMRSFVDKLITMEKGDPNILSLSLIHGFMAGDVPEMGTRMLAVTDGDLFHAESLARDLGMEVFAMRGKSIMPRLEVNEALDQALSAIQKHPGKPVVIADIWDNPGGGTAGDSTIILKALIDRKFTNATVGTIWDPIAVKICMAAGTGSRILLRFGAKSAPLTGDPIDKMVTIVKTVKQAEQIFGSSLVPIGDTVVIEFDGLEVILNSTRAQTFDKSLFEIMGIDPTQRALLVIKSTNHFYDSFSRISPTILWCSAGRPYPNDPVTTDYRKARHTIWPREPNPHGMKSIGSPGI